MNRLYLIAGWGYVAVCSVLLIGTLVPEPPRAATTAAVEQTSAQPEIISGNSAEQWFRRVKPYCNAVELKFVNSSPPPEGWEGQAYLASCYALAGKIDNARRVIDRLEEKERFRAAGVVFNVGHPVADAGDDQAAGPIMELVIDYWPNHYMALYHAGMAEYMLGQSALAKKNLQDFLRVYQQNDGWTSNAREILKRLEDPGSAAAQDLRRPVEP
jgi:tetratricopeptide (TPR) repeat protein